MSRPTYHQLAVAVALIKCKPKDSSVTDYIDRLGAAIKSGRASVHQHLDHSAFHRSDHVRIRELLEQENFALKQQLEILEAKISDMQSASTKTSTDSLSNSSRKRKAIRDSQNPSKRSRITVGPTATLPASSADDRDAFRDAKPEQRVLRNLRRLHKMLRGQMFGADPKTLAFYVTDTAQGLAIVVDQLRMQPLPSKRIKADDTEDNYQTSLAITAIARSFTTLLHAIKRISEYPESDQLFGNIVYYCYKLFDSIITTIEEAANSEAKSQLTAELSKKQSTKPKRAEKNTASASHPVIPALTGLMRAMIDKLDTEMPCHNQILEGLFFALMQRLGEIEHVFAFSGPRIEDMEEAIRTLPPSDEKLLDPAHRMLRRAMVIEAPYLLDILNKAIQSLPATSRRNAPGETPSKHTLMPEALDRLQRTLVDCIFGPGTRGDQASMDFIKQPVLSGPALTLPRTPQSQKNDKEEMVAGWFEEELWALIGWEILGRDEDLSSL